MEVCPGVILLTPHAHTCFPGWTSMLRGALHCRSGSLTLSTSKAYGPCSLATDATLRLQITGAVVYRGRTSSGSLPHLPSLWVQHPPGTLSCPFILYSDEATVQGQIVSD